MPTFSITTPYANQQYEAVQTFGGEFLFIKNAYVAGLLTQSAFTPISDTDYPGFHTYSVTSITRSGSTATVTTATTNTLEVGDAVIIAGAAQAEYNGTFTVTALTTPGTVFTYTVSGAPATPATGTITVTGGQATVPGIVYLDDYIFVGTTKGELRNCVRTDYDSWEQLDFITPEKEPSLLVAIAKSLNFLVAFKQWDTEFFYNAQQPSPGSPLLPQESAYIKLGCASAQSIVAFDGGIVFMSKRDQLQRSREIHVLNGLTPQRISDAPVERLLNADDLSTVYSLYLSTAGRQFYILTLVNTGITLAYDFGSKIWAQWTTLTAQSSKSVISLTRSGTTVTASIANHGYSDGDPVTIAGANSGYNGTFNVRYVDVNTVTYQITDTPTSPATGTITAVGYTEAYLDAIAYATYQNLDLTLSATTGLIYALDEALYQDTDVPINVSMRTANWDGGSNNQKSIIYARPIGDRVESSVLLRYSDDDYGTYSKYRPMDMSPARPQISSLGGTRRRAYELRHTADTELRIEALETAESKGYT